tara:strand:- start:53 stop:337 length:285 start_codon:yes stop_codon:yes gene_type:complete
MAKCPHTARRRRSSLLNVLTGGRRGRRAKEHRERWAVTLHQDVSETATVEVWAKDQEDAIDKALEIGYSGDVRWDLQGAHDLDVVEVEWLETRT